MKKIRRRKSFMVSAYLSGAILLALLVGGQFAKMWMPLAVVFWSVLVIGSVCFIWGFLAPTGKIGSALRFFGFRWLGAFTYGFPVLLSVFVVCLFLTDKTDRIAAYGLGVLLVAAVLCFAWWQAMRVRVRTYAIENVKLTRSARVVFLSDLHFESHSKFARLARGIRKINTELKPDVVLLCGDLFYDRVLVGESAKALQAVLSELSAPCGVYACLGNHDIDKPNSNAYTEVEAFLHGCGITLLTDTAVSLPFGNLYGRKDRHLKDRAEPADLLQEIAPNTFTLVIDHQPVEVHKIAATGADLLLCGHTHRGQLLPIPIFHTCQLFYGKKQFGEMWAIVTAGFGWYGPPLRLGSTGEICVVELSPQVLEKSNEQSEKSQ